MIDYNHKKAAGLTAASVHFLVKKRATHISTLGPSIF